jgi:hypothetical protein
VAGHLFARLLALLVVALAVVVFPQPPASASGELASAAAALPAPGALARADLCSVEEWRADPARCLAEFLTRAWAAGSPNAMRHR